MEDEFILMKLIQIFLRDNIETARCPENAKLILILL